MRTNVHNFNNSLIILQNEEFLINQRVAGKVLSSTLSMLETEVNKQANLSLLQLNDLAEEFILDNKCDLTFKGYKGFPYGCCISVNKQLVHGIATDYHLKEGDIVSFDMGATYKKSIADSAITCIFGQPKNTNHTRLIESTYESLIKGIKAIKIGARLGVIGNAIYRHAKNNGFGVITNYGGHGLSVHPVTQEPIAHADPFVHNKSTSNDGIRISAGLTLAIEPMLTIGDTYTYVGADGWTVYTSQDVNAHFEHSIYIHTDCVEILTRRDNELIDGKYYYENKI